MFDRLLLKRFYSDNELPNLLRNHQFGFFGTVIQLNKPKRLSSNYFLLTKSYLSNRYFSVYINSEQSKFYTIKSAAFPVIHGEYPRTPQRA